MASVFGMIDTPVALTYRGPDAGKWFMAQLAFFSRSEIASWRDRAASRNYSPEGEQRRRDHARHREWGLRQRHGRRLMHLRIYGQAARPQDCDPRWRPSEPLAPMSEPTGSDGRSPAQTSTVSCDREPAQAPDTSSVEAGESALAVAVPSAADTQGGEVVDTVLAAAVPSAADMPSAKAGETASAAFVPSTVDTQGTETGESAPAATTHPLTTLDAPHSPTRLTRPTAASG